MTPEKPTSFPRRSHRRPNGLRDDSVSRVIADWHVTRPDLAVEPIAVTARLARLQAMMAPRHEAVFQRFGIRGADFAVLATLTRLKGARVSQSRLGAELGLSPGTVSLRVDRLVRRELVHRQPDPEDGRGALLSLSEGGRELFEACAPIHLANAESLLAGLSERERNELGRLLGRLLSTLEAPEPDTGREPQPGLAVG
jgi:DNA-binding MarR family transcriptional regulator